MGGLKHSVWQVTFGGPNAEHNRSGVMLRAILELLVSFWGLEGQLQTQPRPACRNAVPCHIGPGTLAISRAMLLGGGNCAAAAPGRAGRDRYARTPSITRRLLGEIHIPGGRELLYLYFDLPLRTPR